MINNIGKKLIGNEDKRAVSPVIGVILMVAITVILAAVIAAFVLDLGDSVGEEAQAGVSIDVDENEDEIQIEITSSGNADDFKLGGEATSDNDGDLNGAGDVVTLDDDSDFKNDLDSSGSVTVIAVIDADGTETQVASADYDFES